MITNETKLDLLKDLKLDEKSEYTSLEAMAAADTRYLKDLRINLKNTLSSENLNIKEAYLIALAIASNEKNEPLTLSFSGLASVNGASTADIAEAHAAASLLSVNNVFYRFKHFLNSEDYTPRHAGIKMNVMASPVLGKELFELVCLAVSAVNGCQMCAVSHEASVRRLGASADRVFDAIRLASVIKGLCVAIH